MHKVRSEAGGYIHRCPACDHIHYVAVDIPLNNGARWTFNDDMASPTFSPSLKHTKSDREGRQRGCCHYFIKEGQIQFLGDCTHEMAGRTVPLPPM